MPDNRGPDNRGSAVVGYIYIMHTSSAYFLLNQYVALLNLIESVLYIVFINAFEYYVCTVYALFQYRIAPNF